MSFIRAVLPDIHGCYADKAALAAVFQDLEYLKPQEVIILGDMIDVGGLFTSHAPNYLGDMAYSYEEDCAAANDILDRVQGIVPKARIDYIEGNHEARVEKFISRTYRSEKDAKQALEDMAPWLKLRLKDRGVAYHRCTKFHDGLSVPGVIKRGKCHFMHGFSCSKHTAAAHVDAVGANVVFGHVHRSQSHIRRNLASGEIGGWCPGTLSVLQPLYMHTAVTAWTSGYAVQACDRDGSFMHLQIPIVRGKSKLRLLMKGA